MLKPRVPRSLTAVPGRIDADIATLAMRAHPSLAQLIDYLHVPLRALAVDGAHQLPFFLCTQTVVCRDLLARERSLFPPACVLFEQFKNGIS